ncbi:MAG: ABC transporter related protein [Microgenomates group bacterium GW2011_GWC1_38_14]|nr:MAG: ABC transporter related protein [Candidatus Levybacteria bacterium GW2011_GWA2_36_13]KKQ01140.1 MAG: ABC transporter related protein [Candidatus Levybacteria bacterium GW2011_GWB1_36_18]KKQ58422.1 MAG: ABC transporter related protein [Microgenomates group bacterium GW2011_GWC1_38_14]KKR16469.1 MAG: ABC transporter related protein [Candidatus Levybacteria bacterium GW2011_GWA1_39_34]OGH44691.1 MAG: ABC transporter [Candidatus Levybacteria bacterium RIFCSPLOWO2_02_FULL_37_11]
MVISVDNLSKNYQVFKKEPGLKGSLFSLLRRKQETVQAVKNISLKISEGELVGFIGPNGAGKTTTLKCLSGLLYPTSGKIEVLGFNPYERKKEFLKQIGLIMGQKNQLWWDLPAIDTFTLQKEIYEIPDSEYKKNLSDLVNLLDAEEFLKTPVKKLSLGQRMKMEIVATLLHTPRVLFLDEPTIGLDVVMQQALRNFIKEYNKRYKSTVILTSHYMVDVEELCKRVIIINHGKILYDGLLSNLVKKYTAHKTIKITLKEKTNEAFFSKLGEVEYYSYPNLTLLVKRTDTSSVVSKILDEQKVEDINIEEPEIEDVIRKVFTGEK